MQDLGRDWGAVGQLVELAAHVCPAKRETDLPPALGERSVATLAADTKLAGFAAGVEVDKGTVAAAISTPWSSDQIEGKINRLKAIKRQM